MPPPLGIPFLYDNNRELKPFLIQLTDDRAQYAFLEKLAPSVAAAISESLGSQITSNLSFWKLATPRSLVDPLPPDVPLATLAVELSPFKPVEPHVSDDMISLVVRWTPTQHRGEKRPLEESKEKLLRNTRLNTGAPSTVAQQSEFKSWHHKDLSLLDYRRNHGTWENPEDNPPHSQYAPISLQYDGFGLFLDVFRGCEDVQGMQASAETQCTIDKFADEMSHIYPDEFSRRSTGLTSLNKIIKAHGGRPSFRLMPAEISSKSFSDGHFLGPHGVACCLVVFKNKQGTGTAIPYVEITSYFAHSTQQAADSPASMQLMMGWNVPCLGITIVGFEITFYAMLSVGDGQWRVVSLTPGLSCIREAGEGDDRTTLYNAFKAASVLLARIDQSATQMLANPPLPSEGNRNFPYVSSLCHPGSGSRVEFKIDKPFSSLSTNRLLFFATTTDNKKILVKFSRRYCDELHMFCANRGHAPALLGFERLPGGLFGIAMEYAESFIDIMSHSRSHKVEQWAKQLLALVKSFHAVNLVHGDLQCPNIICNGDKIFIVDFDWGGKDGAVFYPHFQLASDLTVGRKRKDLAITKDDDLRVLGKTLEHLGLQCDYGG